MKPTKFWSWSLKSLEGRSRYVMRGKYTEDEAHRYFPNQDPQKVEGSVEVRDLPETVEETQAMQTSTALTKWHLEQKALRLQAENPATPPPAP